MGCCTSAPTTTPTTTTTPTPTWPYVWEVNCAVCHSAMSTGSAHRFVCAQCPMKDFCAVCSVNHEHPCVALQQFDFKSQRSNGATQLLLRTLAEREE